MEKMTFEGAIPSIQTAITCGDDCDRLKLDCYNIDTNALKRMKGKQIRVTLEEVI